MIYALLLLTLYVWPFGQLLTFSIPSVPFTVYLLDVVVFFVFISLIISKKRKEIFKSSVTKPLLFFLWVAVLSLLTNIKQGIASGLPLSVLYLVRLIIYPSLFFAGKYIGFERLKKPVIISIGIFTILCLVQYLFFPDMRYLKNLGFDDHYYRLIGTFFDPNFTGAILAGLTLFFIGKNGWLYSLPFLGLLALTFSRASYFVFFIVAVYRLIFQKKIKLLLALLIILSFTVILIPKPFGEGVNLLRTFSIYSRVESWQQGLNLFLQRPIIGWGFNTLRGADNARFQVDNSYIFLLATTGILGLLSFVYLLIKVLKNTVDEGVRLFVIALLIHSLFNNSLFYIWISAPLWLALGIGQNKPKGYK